MEIKQHLHDMRQFYEFLNHKSETEVRMCDPAKFEAPRSTFCKSADEFVDVCDDATGNWNIYAGINERTSGGKKDADVQVITCIGHDVDCHAVGSSLDKAREVVFKLKDDCIAQGFQEPMIVFSGGGYWVLHKVEIPNTAENHEKILMFARKIKKIYETDEMIFDTAVYNASRIARVPGTINFNTGAKLYSKILNCPPNTTDLELTKSIMTMEPPKMDKFIPAETPGTCKFMEYCFHNKLPTGERHNKISRNMALYIRGKHNTEALVMKYIAAQEEVMMDITSWLGSDIKSPFSCGELINYQKKWNIPFQCADCEKLKCFYDKQKPAVGWGKVLSIKKIATRRNFTQCPKCKVDFEFDEKWAFFKCPSCKEKGGLKAFLVFNFNNRPKNEWHLLNVPSKHNKEVK